jgi:hypothetical protein
MFNFRECKQNLVIGLCLHRQRWHEMLCLQQCNHCRDGFGSKSIILGTQQNSARINRQAQQQIINEMGTGMDIDAFVQT